MDNDITFLNLANIRDLEKGAIFPQMPDLALIYLSEYIDRKGFTTQVFDEHVDGSIGDNPHLFHSTRYIGISMYGLNNSLNLHRIKKWKQKYPEVKLILGGSSVGFDIAEKLKFVDYQVIGRGYEPLISILSNKKTPSIIHGELGFEKDFAFQFHLTHLEKYNSAAVLSTFGCPYRCSFCLSNKLKKFKVRKRQNVLAELDLILRAPSIKYFEFFDDILVLNPFLKQYLNRVKGKKPWGCVSDVRTYDDGLMEEMVDSGMITIGFGFESLNDLTLRALNKRQTLDRIEICLRGMSKLAKTSRVRPHAFLMYGLPYQTKDDFLRELDRVESYGFFTQSTHLKVIPGTTLWSERNKYGIEIDSEGMVFKTSWAGEDDLNLIDEIMEKKNKESIAGIWGGLL